MLRWQRIACVPLGGQTCEHGESDCVLIALAVAQKKRGRNGQESRVVVRGGRDTRCRAVEALIEQRPFEMVERAQRGGHRPGRYRAGRNGRRDRGR